MFAEPAEHSLHRVLYCQGEGHHFTPRYDIEF